MIGWVLFALLLGFIAGIGVAWFVLPRRMSPELAQLFARAAAAKAGGVPPGTIITAPDKQPEAKPLVTDEGRQLLINDLITNDNLPKEVAETVATQLLEAATALEGGSNW